MGLVTAVGSIVAMEEQKKKPVVSQQEESSDSEEESDITKLTKEKDSSTTDKNTKKDEKQADSCKSKCAMCEKVKALMPSCEAMWAFAEWPLRKVTKATDSGKTKPRFSPLVNRFLGISWKAGAVVGSGYLVKKLVDKCSCKTTASIN